MKVLHAKCAGLDVHKDSVQVHVRIQRKSKIHRERQRFGTTTADLLRMRDWLTALQVTHVAMEATGVYWKPVWHVLEQDFALLLANPLHVRNVKGRKSDVSDAEWISELLAHGLITASMVPPAPIQELRDLTRTRRQLVREIGQHTQRIQRVLEDANVKLSSVISDVMGMSGRRIIKAIVDGEDDPERLATHGSERLKCTAEELREALRGRVTPHHRFLLRQHLDTVDHLQKTVEAVELQIEEHVRPFRKQFDLLLTIPGFRETAAAAVLAEIGTDMSRFPSAGHLVSWAGLCPRLDESAGKHRSTRIRKSAPTLKPVLVQCAWGAARTKGTYAQGQFLRLKARRGPLKAVIAVASSLLTAIYYMLRDNEPYREVGPNHVPERDRKRAADRLAKRIRSLGYNVTMSPAA